MEIENTHERWCNVKESKEPPNPERGENWCATKQGETTHPVCEVDDRWLKGPNKQWEIVVESPSLEYNESFGEETGRELEG